jgi:hypothetical protein
MRRWWTTLLCSAVLPHAIALPAAAQSAAETPVAESGRVDSGWIVSKLARPAPMRTSFVEVRSSKLLKAPLRIAGEYLRPDEATLVRQVRAPYAETTTIRDGQAAIERRGQQRRYSLARVPELAGLQSSFGALLNGDRAALERDFRLEAQGTRARWTLTLLPKNAALAGQVQRLALYGRGAELRCIETVPAKGDQLQRTLLASAARAVGAEDDAAALVALCRGGS